MSSPTRVLIVEDSVVQRKVLRTALENEPRIEVVGHASNGKLALDRIAVGDVDVITLDLEMPVMGGLEVLEDLRRQGSAVGAIVVSAMTQAGAQATLEAMRLGAFDLITKPNAAGDIEDVIAGLRAELIPRIVACATFLAQQQGQGNAVRAPRPRAPLPATEKRTQTGYERLTRPPAPPGPSSAPPELLVIGTSTGGPQALDLVLPGLPENLGVPVLLVQHMPPMFTRTLAESLDRKCALKVAEARDGQLIRPGEVLVAPGGFQMGIRQRGTDLRVKVCDDPPERSCKPSVDYLFRAAAEIVGERTLAVIMTGMGDDGTAGIRLLKQRGARVFAQNEASSVVFGMPKAAVEEGLADRVLSLGELAGEISAACRKGVTT